MAEARTGPMGVGDILDETIRLYRQQALVYIGIMALAFVPLTILAALTGLGVGLSALSNPALFQSLEFLASAAVTLMVIGLLYFGAFLITQGVATLVAAGGFLARPLQLLPAFGVAARHLLGLLGVTLLVGVLLVGVAVADLAVTVLLFVLNPLFGLAVLVLRVPVSLLAVLLSFASSAMRGRALRLLTVVAMPLGAALYWGVRWSLFVQTLMLEGLGPAAALRRSWELIEGYWWRTLGFLVLLGVLVGVLQLVPGLLLAIPSAALEALLQPDALEQGFPITSILQGLGSVLGLIIFGAVQWLAMTVYYFDLRIRKEAFDLELRAQRLRAG